MQEVELTILRETPDSVLLRMTGSGILRSRTLDFPVLDGLLSQVEDAYDTQSAPPLFFGHSRLVELGSRLYNFLDGNERWLSEYLAHPDGTVLRITTEERLRHLPWDLMCVDGEHLSANLLPPLLVVRTVNSKRSRPSSNVPPNRPLRVLFLATAPEGTVPTLAFEQEEARILQATVDTGTELIVEESGSLDGLQSTIEFYGRDYFDVLHISGHATVNDGEPAFVFENEVGHPEMASADQISRSLSGQWPRLVFASGCSTATSLDQGGQPALSESLVRAGAPAVLGWALPVGDRAATSAAASLYRSLAAGRSVGWAIAATRSQLFEQESSSWHLLRLYADVTVVDPMVTPRATPGREPIKIRPASQAFLDPLTQLSRVASREDFVGRRRLIQSCLRTLMQPLGTPDSAEGLVLRGMGGLGKSTLASRLLERIPTHQRVVFSGRTDDTKLREHLGLINYPSMDDAIQANGIMDDTRIDLAGRLRYLLDGPLRSVPCIFVFDDFEKGNLEQRSGKHVLSAPMANILASLLKAIRLSNSASRVIITSRYEFQAPSGCRLDFRGVETLRGADLLKKVANLENLRSGSGVPQDLRERAIEAAAGSPRLLEWLDKIVVDADLQPESIIAEIEKEADRFREEILAERLLETLADDSQKMLAKLNLIELPVPFETVKAISHPMDPAESLGRAVHLSLVEEGVDSSTKESRYYVSNVLRPLLQKLLSDEERKSTYRLAAKSLYELWISEEFRV